jgi:sensor histidine kinase YesM
MPTITIFHIRQVHEDRNFMSVHMQRYPFIFSDERKYRLQRHISFWAFWWIFQGFLYSFAPMPFKIDYVDRLPLAILDSLLYLPAHIFLAYSLMYFVIPVYIIKGKYIAASVWVLALFVVTALMASIAGKYLLLPVRDLILPSKKYFLPHPTTRQSIYIGLLAGLRGGITVGGMAAAIKLMKYWYIKEQRNLQLQKENAESQLQLLKAQVHPHFLFNTLNNIYAHAQSTAPVAAKMLTGLSDMLRFMLYECNQPLAPLSKELKMIQDYIALEKIRYGNKLELHLDIPANTYDLHIAPLLLLPFIENSFKHGASNMLEHPWVNMQISLHGRQMHMKLLNGKASIPKKETTDAGIGIENVKRRLELLYPGKHELSITNEEEVFIVNLKVDLEQKKDFIHKPVTGDKLAHA